MSRFKEGQAKPKNSGRQKGTPNQRTLLLKEALEQLGHDLPTKIVELLPDLSADRQMDVYLELMQYIYPKRKSVELSGQEDRPIGIEVQNDNIKRILSDPDALAAIEKLERNLESKADAEL